MQQRWQWKHFPAHLKLSLVYLHSDPWCCALLITAARQGDFPNKAELSFMSQQVIIQLRNTSMARLWALPATFSSKVYFSVGFPALVRPQSPHKLVNSVAEMLVTFTWFWLIPFRMGRLTFLCMSDFSLRLLFPSRWPSGPMLSQLCEWPLWSRRSNYARWMLLIVGLIS